jgi:hypothetical protein
MFYVFGVGLVILCYSIIKFATKQSQRNNAVIVASAISVALIIGNLLFEMFG